MKRIRKQETAGIWSVKKILEKKSRYFNSYMLFKPERMAETAGREELRISKSGKNENHGGKQS